MAAACEFVVKDENETASNAVPQTTDEADDPNVTAFNAIRQATAEKPEEGAEAPDDAPPEKNPAAVALGRLGGLKGGKARAEKLTADERSEIASLAAKARWKKARERDD